MILINLLPEEYRERRRTPRKKFAAVTLGVAVNATLIAWWSWLAFGVTAGVELERDLRREEMERFRPLVAYHRALERENRAYESREETLAKITQNRVSWTRKLDDLIDLVNEGGKGEDEYLVWLDDVDIDQKGDARMQAYGKLRSSGHSAYAKFENVSTFLEDAGSTNFGDVFHPPAPPKATKAPDEPAVLPKEYWNFTLEVELLPPDERAQLGGQEAQR